MEHLKVVALKTSEELDITIGAYVILYAKYLKVNIYKERVQGNPQHRPSIFSGATPTPYHVVQEEDGTSYLHTHRGYVAWVRMFEGDCSNL